MLITQLKIRLNGDPCLRKISSTIKEASSVERLLIRSMLATMRHYKGVGLAAPQVGINQRVIVVDIGDGPIALVNPVILKQSGSWEMEEGCLSVPDRIIPIKRSQKVSVEYLDENNKIVKEEYVDLMSRVILHEVDHLDGKLIIDYAAPGEIKEKESQTDS